MALDCTEEKATSAFGFMSIFVVCFGHFMGFDHNNTLFRSNTFLTVKKVTQKCCFMVKKGD